VETLKRDTVSVPPADSLRSSSLNLRGAGRDRPHAKGAQRVDASRR
jgi:hypothetical protein